MPSSPSVRIYFDHNATTPTHPDVKQALLQALAHANPSSLHEEGRAARSAVERARQQVAALLGLGQRTDTVVFTSGGTEGNNTAILGAVRALAQRTGRRDQVVSSPLEHPSVKAALSVLQTEGTPITLLPVDARGRLDPDDLARALRENRTALVTLALANHEIGNLYPIAALSSLCHQHDVLLHCDGVQAVGRVPVSVSELGVDFLTVSSHKLHGPQGIGALYCKGPLTPSSLLVGGQQEKGRRAGTQNVPGIVGFGVACQIAAAGMEQQQHSHEVTTALRDRLEQQLLSIEGARLHGDNSGAGSRTPGTCNVAFEGVEGELLMMNLDLLGVAVSTGAACSSGSAQPSEVLLALGLSPERALEGVRFSLGPENTAEQVDQVALWVHDIVARVRSL